MSTVMYKPSYEYLEYLMYEMSNFYFHFTDNEFDRITNGHRVISYVSKREFS